MQYIKRCLNRTNITDYQAIYCIFILMISIFYNWDNIVSPIFMLFLLLPLLHLIDRMPLIFNERYINSRLK